MNDDSGARQPEVPEEGTPPTEELKMQCCQNYIRRNFDAGNTKSPYCFTMELVWSLDLRDIKIPIRRISYHGTTNNHQQYLLSEECARSLKKPAAGATWSDKNHQSYWKNIWPSFLWDRLTGMDEVGGVLFHGVYSSAQLYVCV